MYAVVQLGSSQYKVKEGDVIEAQLLGKKDNESVTLDKVLLFADGQSVKVGQPFLTDVRVSAKVLGEVKGEKAFSFKYLRRKFSSWRKGHRQKYTRLSITKISPV